MVELVVAAFSLVAGWFLNELRGIRAERRRLAGLLLALRVEARRNRELITPAVSHLLEADPSDKVKVIQAHAELERIAQMPGMIQLEAWAELRSARLPLDERGIRVVEMGREVEGWLLNLPETTKPPESMTILPPLELLVVGETPYDEQERMRDAYVEAIKFLRRKRVLEEARRGLQTLDDYLTAVDEAIARVQPWYRRRKK